MVHASSPCTDGLPEKPKGVFSAFLMKKLKGLSKENHGLTPRADLETLPRVCYHGHLHHPLMAPSRMNPLRALKDLLFPRTGAAGVDRTLPSLVPSEVLTWLQGKPQEDRDAALVAEWIWAPTTEGQPRGGPLLLWAFDQGDAPLISALLGMGAFQRLPQDRATGPITPGSLFGRMYAGHTRRYSLSDQVSLTQELLDAGVPATPEAVRWAVWFQAYDPFLILLPRCEMTPADASEIFRTAHQVGASEAFIDRLVEAGHRLQPDDLEYGVSYVGDASKNADERAARWQSVQMAKILNTAVPASATTTPVRPRQRM